MSYELWFDLCEESKSTESSTGERSILCGHSGSGFTCLWVSSMTTCRGLLSFASTSFGAGLAAALMLG